MKEEQTINKNLGLVAGLRALADFLESRPEMPALKHQRLCLWAWRDMDLFRVAARQLGSFTKKLDDNYFELHRLFGADLELVVTLDREAVCKKIVTWECPDENDSLLKMVGAAECGHDRLNEDGICRACGADRRGM